ncbi:DUF3857 and transglutaminase domain-containing protein [Mangrovibacterium lignilyticum]|uniref:DUF3857 and transglutaminase domain-containing protein n=1 Tax=Mangrovibacterium lignilyticum TaxID=2668052 RepID=UPI0013D12364|nr:DUF3857 and transglutaminase domain-containing protein [Mangrovibacterium lignilyticum]
MKNFIFLLLLIFSAGYAAFAQTYSREFGIVGKDDLEMNVYSEDKDAEAVVMFDFGKSYFQESDHRFNVIFERSTRVKVLNEAGVKWAEFEIPFYQYEGIYERIYDLEAYTYNLENGVLTRTALDLSNTYNEAINDYWTVKKFAMPNVKPGSIVEYRYKLESQYKFNLRDWEFQWKIPVIYSEYIARMIPFYTYTYLLQGASRFDIFDSYEDYKNKHNLPWASAFGTATYSDLVYKFGMENVPAFNDEEFITSVDDYIIKLDFQLSQVNLATGGQQKIMTTWEELVKELGKHTDFGKYIDKSEKVAAKILPVKELAQKNESVRMDAVIDYVKLNFGWNRHFDKYASKSPSKVVDEKLGNCADLNLLTVGFLRAVGIEAYPVITSTRNHGKIKTDYPFSSFFNYVLILVRVDGKIFLTDATDPLCLNSRIPVRCINDRGLVIDSEKIRWIGLENNVPSMTSNEYTLSAGDDFNLVAHLKQSSTEYDALQNRKAFGEDNDEIEKAFGLESFEFDPSSIKIENLTNKKKPFIVECKQLGKMEVINGKIYLNPFLGQTISDNPLKQKSRSYPIDMIFPKLKLYKTTFNLPEGYEPEYLPEEKNINNELFSLSYQVLRQENQLTINFSYGFKKPVYEAKDYSRLKMYFNEIVKKGKDKIVLVPGGAKASASTTETKDVQ